MSTTLTRWPGAKNLSSLRWLHPNLKADGDQALHNNDDSGSEGHESWHDGDDDKNGYIDDDMTIWWGGQHWDRCCWHWPWHPQVGPFVYQALTIKDTVEEDGKSNLHYNEDGSTLTYRPRSPSCQWKWFFWWVIFVVVTQTVWLINQPGDAIVFWWFYFRRFYFLDREQSVGNPDTTYLTVLNLLDRIVVSEAETRALSINCWLRPVPCWYQTVKATSW